MCRKDSQCLTRPQTVGLAPVRHIRVEFLHVACQGFHVVLPEDGISAYVEVLFEDFGPLLTGDTLFDFSGRLRGVHDRQIDLGAVANVLGQLLVGLVVLVLEGTTFVLDDACETIQVGSRGRCSQLRSEAVSSNRGHRDVLFVHETDNVSCHVLEVVAGVMVGVALVAIVEQPNVADVENTVRPLSEELLEVLSRFCDLWQPNHCRQVLLATLQQSALKLHISRVVLNNRLCLKLRRVSIELQGVLLAKNLTGVLFMTYQVLSGVARCWSIALVNIVQL